MEELIKRLRTIGDRAKDADRFEVALRECRRIAAKEYERTKQPAWGRIITLCESAGVKLEKK
jgi:hypothetical protein